MQVMQISKTSRNLTLLKTYMQISVADPGCLSRIPDPDFYPSRIPDPKTVPKERDEKKFCYHTFFCSHKFHKIEYYVIFECQRKKFGPIFKELLKFLPKKFSICSQIYGFGIRDPEKTYSGSRIQGSKRHRIPDPGPGSATLMYSRYNQNLLVCVKRIRIGTETMVPSVLNRIKGRIHSGTRNQTRRNGKSSTVKCFKNPHICSFPPYRLVFLPAQRSSPRPTCTHESAKNTH